MYRAFCPSEASIKVELNVVVFQDKSAQQTSALAEIKQSLQSQNICLDIQYSSTIHDREIRYSSNHSHSLHNAENTLEDNVSLLYIFILFSQV